MGLFEFIKRQQKKPSEERRRIVFYISLSITLVIFFVWLTTIGIRFSSVGETEIKKQNTTIGPLDSLKSSFSEALNAAREVF